MSAGWQLGVLGTGLMGGPMAANLAAAGHKLRVWNRTLEKTKDAGTEVTVCTTPEQAVRGADAVIVMLSSGPVCAEVLFGSSGAAQAMAKGASLIVMSSIAHDEAKAMAVQARGMGLIWVDAPVSGGTVAAAAGTLSIMVGGEADQIAALHPVLSAMGTVTHVGPDGSGALTKLVNQLLVASTICAVSEALLLARQGGADVARVRQALLGGFAGSRILDLHGARMIAGDFTPGGPAKYQIKDTGAAKALAQSLGLELPLLGLADQLFTDLVAHGGGDLDHSALILELERRNGLRPKALA
ncbi:MAG: NAD(P)-dependent oxidoreductase [Pseudotabrizicola sp.]|uniref:NAD(P)-dependent oxidoreductase n=1 Tax=Pseudotabrizicola sp. TaxID=2939647 RepID=UPI0027244DE1|nr:NAD(P)-dependent oxidoreductase [Pseudotabrizicola sp.]MDO8884590.1 NAD(P)-dependent oxidoreductase [Pseudotabrizicola sp.]MDP2083501.1 NAD(P)-dependent oxidoreductase [Pseudotabrizicola sp.]MDZ7572886.1 NAD(P)-dependent oxidoreductase [Pseudotabrizicola sp.]